LHNFVFTVIRNGQIIQKHVFFLCFVAVVVNVNIKMSTLVVVGGQVCMCMFCSFLR